MAMKSILCLMVVVGLGLAEEACLGPCDDKICPSGFYCNPVGWCCANDTTTAYPMTDETQTATVTRASRLTTTQSGHTQSHKQCPNNWYQETVFPNKCIKFVTEIQPWFGAKYDCGTLGNNATLLSIDSAFENAEIYRQAGDDRCPKFYTGLINTGGSWHWDNGDVSSYMNWKAGYPKSSADANCGAFDRKSGKWINEGCGASHCYICQMYV